MLKKVEIPKLSQVQVTDSFWSPIQNLITDDVIVYQEKILNDEIPDIEKSHALANFRIAAKLEEGEFYGMVFQDSDVAKWLEGVAYSLVIKPDAELEKRADAIIEIIEKAQQEDGYLNTFFTIKEPEHRWQNLQECHELYCAGHMMEAAVAYYEATGKDRLLNVMKRMADHICNRFGEGKTEGVPGHEEVEIGLLRLYEVTGVEAYKEMASYFIETRGKDPEFFKKERQKRGWIHFDMDPADTKYSQCYAPIREQKSVEGHSVRAVYYYTAAADLALQNQDESLKDACDALWNNMIQKRMYITGGIGSNAGGEAFTLDYDLPNDSVYAETCASIGMLFWGKKMLQMQVSNQYTDAMERALYNGVISGMQLDGKRFFYVNPLEVNPGISGKLHGFQHVLPMRPKWYACACCPPNVVRLMTSLGTYIWSESEDTMYSHFYIGSTLDGKLGKVTLETEYPKNGVMTYEVTPKAKQPFTVAIRIPGWCKDAKLSINGEAVTISKVEKDGYAYLTRAWKEGDKVCLQLVLEVQKYFANPMVKADAGKLALVRGPQVYCFESVDNPYPLARLRVKVDGSVTEQAYEKDTLNGILSLTVEGYLYPETENLYLTEMPKPEAVTLKAIPYHTWGNRGENQMWVWMSYL